MANPWEFLRDWCSEHVNPTGYDDTTGAEYLANECLRDAKKAGISQAALIKAAGGNLASFMLSELESAVNREVDRLASKRD
jgi:uroporphyrinogen-III decarboxylase